ncbi:hypothetical protein MIR68_010934 [Amoeboaphelidium protococcarum]|nr:hypothetical protein MIR68_010934 [Amoeboaphelidium protococcarum]
MEPFKIATLIISDRAVSDVQYDQTSEKIKEWLNECLQNQMPFRIGCQSQCADDSSQISARILDLINEGYDWIITSGGTGASISDVTPESVLPLLDKRFDALEQHINQQSLKHTPFAVLSRIVCGLKLTRSKFNGCLITCFPGKPKAVVECLDALVAFENAGGNSQTNFKVLNHLLNFCRGSMERKFHHGMESSSVVTSEVNSNAQNTGDEGCSCGIQVEAVDNRADELRQLSKYPMVELTHVLQKLRDELTALQGHRSMAKKVVDVSQLKTGDVISEDVLSQLNIPSVDVSRMDGYAVKLPIDSSVQYNVVGEVNSVQLSSKPGIKQSSRDIIKVATGVPIPEGTDAVIPVEYASVQCIDNKTRVKFDQSAVNQIQRGSHIRTKGSDLSRGQLVLAKGQMISRSGGEVGLLHGSGVSSVSVYESVKVAVLSSGSEIMAADNDQNHGSFQVRDSNRPMLLHALQQKQGIVALDLGLLADDRQILTQAIEDGLSVCDVLISTGGVSMGDYDLIKPILESLRGVELICGRINIKPGLPTTIAICRRPEFGTAKFIFALPGNPVSALTMFHVIVDPFVNDLYRQTDTQLKSMIVRLNSEDSERIKVSEEFTRDKTRPEVVRLTRNDNNATFRTTGVQVSSRLQSWVAVDALALVPSQLQVGGTSVQKGSLLKLIKRFD